jgi:hypothetical protein
MSDLIEPEPNEKIWRYMNLPKFISILDTKSLYFVKSEKLRKYDPYEGATTERSEIYRRDLLESIANDTPTVYVDMEATIPYYSYVSCWHVNNYESAALWSLYGQSESGIAIQTTYSKLKASFKDDWAKRMIIKKVRYIDYETGKIPFGNIFNRLMHKRKDFEHEKELRAIMFHPDGDVITNMPNLNLENGIYVPVEVNKLIETIYIAPVSPKWFPDLVRSICHKYNFDLNVISSHLMDEPRVI